MIKVTAVLIQWKRQQHLPKIIESLTKCPFIDEILIRDNSKTKNIICYGRYTLAKKAKNHVIYTQDDDCVIHDIPKLYAEYLKDPDTYTVGAIQDFIDVMDKNTYGERQMVFPPWGGFFKKEWVGVLDEYLAKYPKDKLFYREADRIFSILLGKHHKVIKSDVEQLCTHEQNIGVALCEEKNHKELSNLATRRALEL